LIPYFDITSHILAKGDYFALNQNVLNKTITSFRVYADRTSLSVEAMNGAIDYFDNEGKVAEANGGSISENDCDTGDGNLDLSEEEETKLEAFIVKDRAAKIQAFMDKYNVYDINFIKAKNDYEAKLDSYYEQYIIDYNNKRVFSDYGLEANEIVSSDDVGTFESYAGKCYEIDPDGSGENNV
jgi:hypothetical protein